MTDTTNGTLTRRAFTERALAAGVSFGALGSLLAACGGDDGGNAAKIVTGWMNLWNSMTSTA